MAIVTSCADGPGENDVYVFIMHFGCSFVWVYYHETAKWDLNSCFDIRNSCLKSHLASIHTTWAIGWPTSNAFAVCCKIIPIGDRLSYGRNDVKIVAPEISTKAGSKNYIPLYLWDVITCPCPWYLPLALKFSYMILWCNFPIHNVFQSLIDYYGYGRPGQTLGKQATMRFWYRQNYFYPVNSSDLCQKATEFVATTHVFAILLLPDDNILIWWSLKFPASASIILCICVHFFQYFILTDGNVKLIMKMHVTDQFWID